MEQVVAFEIWALSVAAACCVGWLLSDLRKRERLGAAGMEGDSATDGLFSLKVAPKIAPPTPLSDDAGSEDHLMAAQADAWMLPYPILRPILRPVEHTSLDCGPSNPARPNPARPNLTWRRTSSFEDKPPLNQISDHALKTRVDARVWHSPDVAEKLAQFMRSADRSSVNVLIHYRIAIAELQRFTANGSYNDNAAKHGALHIVENANMPRHADAAWN